MRCVHPSLATLLQNAWQDPRPPTVLELNHHSSISTLGGEDLHKVPNDSSFPSKWLLLPLKSSVGENPTGARRYLTSNFNHYLRSVRTLPPPHPPMKLSQPHLEFSKSTITSCQLLLSFSNICSSTEITVKPGYFQFIARLGLHQDVVRGHLVRLHLL